MPAPDRFDMPQGLRARVIERFDQLFEASSEATNAAFRAPAESRAERDCLAPFDNTPARADVRESKTDAIIRTLDSEWRDIQTLPLDDGFGESQMSAYLAFRCCSRELAVDDGCGDDDIFCDVCGRMFRLRLTLEYRDDPNWNADE